MSRIYKVFTLLFVLLLQLQLVCSKEVFSLLVLLYWTVTKNATQKRKLVFSPFSLLLGHNQYKLVFCMIG